MESKNEDLSVLVTKTNKLRNISLVSGINSIILAVAAFGTIWWLIHALAEQLPHIVTREEWMAASSDNDLPNLQMPINRISIISTGGVECKTRLECINCLQLLELISFNDTHFTYNFMVGGDGLIYEGYGWDNIGTYTRPNNDESITIAFIGTFVNTYPSQKQCDALKLLLAHGIRLGKLANNYQIYPQLRYILNTEKAGENIINIVQGCSIFLQGYD